MNRVNLPYVVHVVFCIFMAFWVACHWRPQQKKERRDKACSNNSWLSRMPPEFCPFYTTFTCPSPSSLGQMKTTWCSNIGAKNCWPFNLKCCHKFSHSLPKRHHHRMSKKWPIITAKIKFKLRTKEQTWPLPVPPVHKYSVVISRCLMFKLSDVRGKKTLKSFLSFGKKSFILYNIIG